MRSRSLEDDANGSGSPAVKWKRSIPQIDEGIDTLVGIERIQFADQIYTVRETGNFDPTVA